MTYYYWDEVNDNLFGEEDENGEVIAEYTHEPGLYGELIAQERDGETRYYNYDGLGNTSELTDENQNVTDTYEYSAFGEEIAHTGTTVNPFGYKGALGYYTNTVTNDFDVRARVYNPRVARWLSKDPSPWQIRENPYVYVYNNATNLNDSSGLEVHCSGSLCNNISPHPGILEGRMYINAELFGNVGDPCYRQRVLISIRENHSVYSGKQFLGCGCPATTEIQRMFSDGGDFEFGWMDILAGKVKFEGCELLNKSYRLDANECYDFQWMLLCPLICNDSWECQLETPQFLLGAWKYDRDGFWTGETYDISARYAMFSIEPNIQSECCTLYGCDKLNLKLQWATGDPFKSGDVSADPPVANNCSLSDFPSRSYKPVGPKHPGPLPPRLYRPDLCK